MFLTDADVETNLAVRKDQLDFLDAAAAIGCDPVFCPFEASPPTQ